VEFQFNSDNPTEAEIEKALESITQLVFLTTDMAQAILRAAEISELEAMWKR
jgi:hypothetical protein